MYQVIARKYRPATFSELISQEHVRTTLENAITQRRIAHGYILSGQRGTGKTTVARIIARCLNCIEGPTSHPCGVCASCLEITSGSSVDVIEIDAASNRGINEMRELRENVRYRPARDRYKVFIIDEAHQITTEAFNALLKTLEEPPEWVVFILCTTESHKIPTTIASRCQQFSFRSVDFEELVSRMRWICEQEGIKADDETLAIIARAGEGSVRDSLSALDQAIACCGDTLQPSDVRSLLGMFSMESLAMVAEALESGDSSKMLEIVAELERNGRNLQHFCRELARYFRNLLVAKIANGHTRLISASTAEQDRLVETASKFSEQDLTRYLQIVLDMFKDLQTSLQPRLHLEIGLLRLVHAGKLIEIEQALADLGAGSVAPATAPKTAAPSSRPSPVGARPMAAPAVTPARTGPSPFQRDAARKFGPSGSASAAPNSAGSAAAPAFAPTPITSATAPATQSFAEQAPAPSRPSATPAAVPAPAVEGDTDLRSRIHQTLVDLGMTFTADGVEHSDVRESSPNEVEFITTKANSFMMPVADLQKAVTQAYGKPMKVKVTIGAPVNAAPLAKAQKPDEDEVTKRALAHPDVQKFQELFPDAQVRAVRNLKE